MSKIRLIGRESHFYGKPLYEITANLRTCKGRVVARSTRINRYPEKSYYILEDVKPILTDMKFNRGEAWGYEVFRGKKFPDLKKIETGQKSDWFLVPKDQEEEFCKIDKVYTPVRNPPKELPFPPVLKMVLERRISARGVTIKEPHVLTIRTRKSREKTFQEQL